MDALVIVVIVVAVLMGLIGLGVVAGSGRTRRMDERRFHAEEVRREAEFQDARAEQAQAEADESIERSRRFERRAEGEEVPPDAEPEDPAEQLPGRRDDA
jgi:Tfp pilus assembly protein PilX